MFESTAEFANNEASTTDNTNLGRGGAIYNARIGSITFNGQLTATENNADVSTTGMRESMPLGVCTCNVLRFLARL